VPLAGVTPADRSVRPPVGSALATTEGVRPRAPRGGAGWRDAGGQECPPSGGECTCNQGSQWGSQWGHSV